MFGGYEEGSMSAPDRYLDYSGREDRLSGGVRRIPIDTPRGRFTVWTRRVGNNPALKVLLLHGGPGATHEYFGACDSYLPAAGIEYEHHILRMPAESWPDPVQRTFAHINAKIYVLMNGPSELGMSAGARLARWDRVADLPRVEVPALVIGARYDTMDPAHMEMIAGLLPRGRYLYCPKGSHLAIYDDQETYFAGLAGFLRGLPMPGA